MEVTWISQSLQGDQLPYKLAHWHWTLHEEKQTHVILSL